jgi:hypothetical protein
MFLQKKKKLDMPNDMCFFMSLLYSKINIEFHISSDELLKIIWQNRKEKKTGRERHAIYSYQYSFTDILILFPHFHVKLKFEFKDLFNY